MIKSKGSKSSCICAAKKTTSIISFIRISHMRRTVVADNTAENFLWKEDRLINDFVVNVTHLFE